MNDPVYPNGNKVRPYHTHAKASFERVWLMDMYSCIKRTVHCALVAQLCGTRVGRGTRVRPYLFIVKIVSGYLVPGYARFIPSSVLRFILVVVLEYIGEYNVLNLARPRVELREHTKFSIHFD
jgi:hypothetical protein